MPAAFDAAQRLGPRTADAYVHVFRPETLRRASPRTELMRRLLARPEWLFRPLRTVCPTPRLGGIVLVLRYDDVQEVLTRQDVFAVPYGARIMAVDRTRQNFILGMDDDAPAYQTGLARVMRAMRRDDLGHVGGLSRRFAEDVLRAPSWRIDIVGRLFTPVTTHIVAAYLGVPAATPDIALWAMALSNWIFATPGEDETARQAALGAGERLGRAVDAAIERAMARAGRVLAPALETVADRLVRNYLAAATDAPLAAVQDAIRPALDGLITAFIPNCTVAATNILNVLLDRPDIMARCRAAAQTADDAALGRHLLEAFRFRPLFLGPLRRCSRNYVLAADTARAVPIAAGTQVLACTQSAMFDGRRVTRPRTFDPDRAASHSMQFGFGLHACVGAAVATAQLVNMFRPLLHGAPFARAAGESGQPAYFGAFPERMFIRFGA